MANGETGTTKSHDYDVVVIGGGPAGSTVATLLSMWGRRVLLLERDFFPRHHVGESLLPGTEHVLKRLGVYDEVNRGGFTHKYGASYVWGRSRKPWTIYFPEVSSEGLVGASRPDHSFQVDRAKFDKILLDHSRDSGVTVSEGCRATGVVRDSQDTTLVNYLDHTQTAQTASCRICVDASGQNSILSKDFRLRRSNPSFRNIAVYGYFQGGKTVLDLEPGLNPKNAGNILIVANEAGWIWYIPLEGNRFSVGQVMDAASATEINRVGSKKFLLDNIDATPETAFLLKEARLEPDLIRTESDWSYICRKFHGPGFLLVGDAACFIDPVLSSGVYLAMESALKAALAINTSLGRPELTDQAMQWYEEEYRIVASNFLQMAEHWYAGHRSRKSWFSTARGLIDPNNNLSIRQAFIHLVGGHTGLSGQPDLLPFGGWSPPELETMYANLERVTPGQSRAKRRISKPDPQIIVRNVAESIPHFESGVRYGPYMVERGNSLTPIFQVAHEVHGIVANRFFYQHPGISLILDNIDGKRSVRDIFDELGIQSDGRGQSDVKERQEYVTRVVQDLYHRKLLVPEQSRPPTVTAGQTTRNVGGQAAPSKIGRNDPCPCGSGRKYKRCHGR